MNDCSLCGGTERVRVIAHDEDEPQIEDCPRCLAGQLPPVINENAVGYTIDDAVSCLNISERTIRRLVASSKLQATRAGSGTNAPLRFTGRALRQFVDGDAAIGEPQQQRRGRRATRAKFPGVNS